MGTDLTAIRHALELARSRGYTEVEITDAEASFRAKLAPAGFPVQTQAVPAETTGEPEPSVVTADVLAPLVGYFKSGKKPLEVGRAVAKGDVLGIVAALGIDSDIESPVSGTIREVLVKPDQPLEFGQVVARIEVTS